MSEKFNPAAECLPGLGCCDHPNLCKKLGSCLATWDKIDLADQIISLRDLVAESHD